MLLGIVIVLVAVIGVMLVVAATRPGGFAVRRSVVVGVGAEKIFPWVNDFHEWAKWSPFEEYDLAMKKTFSGAASGKGAVYEWEGNSKVGKGRMEVLESVPSGRILIKLDFLKPFEGHNQAEFKFEPKGGGTEVSWEMSGRKAFAMKIFGLFCDMDNMIGRDFQRGLGKLKEISEK